MKIAGREVSTQAIVITLAVAFAVLIMWALLSTT